LITHFPRHRFPTWRQYNRKVTVLNFKNWKKYNVNNIEVERQQKKVNSINENGAKYDLPNVDGYIGGADG